MTLRCVKHSVSQPFCPSCRMTRVATGYTSVVTWFDCSVSLPNIECRWISVFTSAPYILKRKLLHTNLASMPFIMLVLKKNPDWNGHGFWEACLRSACFLFLRVRAPFLNSMSHSLVKHKGDPTCFIISPIMVSFTLSLSFKWSQMSHSGNITVEGAQFPAPVFLRYN